MYKDRSNELRWEDFRHIIKKTTEDLVSFQNNIFQMKHTENTQSPKLRYFMLRCCVQSTNNANNVEKSGFR